MLGANVIVLPTTKEFWPDIEALKKNINKKTKAVIINSPNNPTGAVYPERIIKDIIDVLDPYDTLLVSDEVYEDFIYDVGHVSPLCFYENTILVSSFSKNLALTGQRVGYAAGSRGVLMAMAKLQQYTYVCAPHLAQVAALQNLNLDISNYVSEYKERRDLIYDMLKDTFEIQKPEGAFYIYPKVGDGEKVALKSIEKDLIVVPGQVFSKSNEYLRISYAAPKDVLIKGANILKEVADELR
ncbi:hypothetical protein A2Y26_00365 [candidate division CPR2 bacterium GWD2_39_7]|nr:MAG: Aspartate aminotransferase [candidate division CPR2 bacterium GW2011_GWD2_39_7]OGB70414.1 MAG: hypothetical protein A2Y26_00365 [candidate division CPR2 bacterium GWD2_39_7]